MGFWKDIKKGWKLASLDNRQKDIKRLERRIELLGIELSLLKRITTGLSFRQVTRVIEIEMLIKQDGHSIEDLQEEVEALRTYIEGKE